MPLHPVFRESYKNMSEYINFRLRRRTGGLNPLSLGWFSNKSPTAPVRQELYNQFANTEESAKLVAEKWNIKNVEYPWCPADQWNTMNAVDALILKNVATPGGSLWVEKFQNHEYLLNIHQKIVCSLHPEFSNFHWHILELRIFLTALASQQRSR